MMKRQQGYTLVEMMIAITLGMMVTAGVAAVLVSSSTIFRGADARAQIQAGSRFGMALMEEDVRMAGYMGCFNAHLSRRRLRNLVENPAAFNYNYTQRITGFDGGSGSWSPAIEASIGAMGSHAPVAGTDVLVVRAPVGASLPLSEAMSNANDPIVLGRTDKLEAGTLAVVSDCDFADIFRVTNNPATRRVLHADSLNSDNALTKAYSPMKNAKVTPLATISYFIAPSGSGAEGMRSLWRQVNGDTAEEAVEGVHDLQVEYGLGNAELAATRFVGAGELDANDDVVAVRLTMLLRSQANNVVPAPANYVFNGESNEADDRRVYTPFTTTIHVRNQVN